MFQIQCRKVPGGTSGSFWWIRKAKWSGSGERTSPWRALNKRFGRWCEKSSWRNAWSYDGDGYCTRLCVLCLCFLCFDSKEWPNSELWQWVWLGGVSLQKHAEIHFKSFEGSQSVSVCVCVGTILWLIMTIMMNIPYNDHCCSWRIVFRSVGFLQMFSLD